MKYAVSAGVLLIAVAVALLQPFLPSPFGLRQPTPQEQEAYVLTQIQNHFSHPESNATILSDLYSVRPLSVYQFQYEVSGTHYMLRAVPIARQDPPIRSFYVDDSGKIRESWDPRHSADAGSPLLGTSH